MQNKFGMSQKYSKQESMFLLLFGTLFSYYNKIIFGFNHKIIRALTLEPDGIN